MQFALNVLSLTHPFFNEMTVVDDLGTRVEDCVYNFFMRHQSMSFLGSKIVLCFVLFCFVSFCLKYYLSLMSKMKK